MGIFNLLEHAGDEAFGEEAIAKVIPPSEPKPRKGAQDQQPLQECFLEQAVMTLEECEKMQGKNKSLEPSKPLDEKKVEDDDRLKLENAQAKAKEGAANKGKAPKLTIKDYLRQGDGLKKYLRHASGKEWDTSIPPRPEDFASGGGNGDFSGGNRDNSDEHRVYDSSRGDPPPIFCPKSHEGGSNRGNPRYQQSGGRGCVNGGGYGGRQRPKVPMMMTLEEYEKEKILGSLEPSKPEEIKKKVEDDDRFKLENAPPKPNIKAYLRHSSGKEYHTSVPPRRESPASGSYSGGRVYDSSRGDPPPVRKIDAGNQQSRKGGSNRGNAGYQRYGGSQRPEVPMVDSLLQFPVLGGAAPAPFKQ